MPLPTAEIALPYLSAQLISSGCGGSITTGAVTQVPLNPTERLTLIALQVCLPLVTANFVTGFFVGSPGSPSAAAAIPAPVPSITSAGVRIGLVSILPKIPVTSAQIAAQAVWTGPFSVPFVSALQMGIHMALNATPLTISGAPGDPVFLALTTGFLDFVRKPLAPQEWVPALLAAWSADPDLGPSPRTNLALAYCTAFCDVFNSLILTGAVVNPVPPGIAPVVPGVVYAGLPVVIT